MVIKVKKEDIPADFYNRRDYPTIILYTLGRFGPMELKAFIEDPWYWEEKLMNKNTFYDALKKLEEESNEYIQSKKNQKTAIYSITLKGYNKLKNMLATYNIDKQELIEILNDIDQNRRKDLINLVKPFLTDKIIEKYKLNKEVIAKFYNLAGDLPRIDGLSKEKFFRLVLYLALNFPEFYPKYSISRKGFFNRYNNKEIFKDDVSEADFDFFIQLIVDQDIYDQNYRRIYLKDDSIELYFRFHHCYGSLIDNVIYNHLYDHDLLAEIKVHDEIDLNIECLNIANILIDKFNIFPKNSRDSLSNIILNWIDSPKKDSSFNYGNLTKNKHSDIKPMFNKKIEDGSVYESKEDIQEENKIINIFGQNIRHFLKIETFIKYNFKSNYNNIVETFHQLLEEYNLVDAENLIEEISKSDKHEIYLLKSILALYKKDYKESLRIIQKFSPRNSNNENIYVSTFMKMAVYNELEQYKKVLEFYQFNKNRKYSRLNPFITYQYYIAYSNLKPLRKADIVIDNQIEKEDDEQILELLYELKTRAYRIKGKYDEALSIIDIPLKKYPNNYDLLMAKVITLRLYQKTHDALNILIEILPKSNTIFQRAWNLTNQSMLYFYNMNDSKKALNLISEAIQLRKSPGRYRIKLIYLENLNLKEEIIKIFDESLKLFPNDAELILDKGDFLLSEKKYEDLKEYLNSNENKMKTPTDTKRFLQLKSVLFIKIGKLSEFLANFNLELDLKISEKNLFTYAFSLMNNNHSSEAFEMLDLYRNINPDDDIFYIIKAILLGYQGKHKESLLTIEKVSDKNHPYYIIAKTQQLQKLEKIDDAFEFINKNIKKNPQDNLFSVKADVLKSLGKYREALETIENFDDKEGMLYYMDKLSILKNLEEYNDALKLIDKKIEKNPIDAYYFDKIDILQSQGNYDKALETIKHIDNKNGMLYYRTKLSILKNLEEYIDALKLIDKKIEKNPIDAYYFDKIDILQSQGNYDKALETIEKMNNKDNFDYYMEKTSILEGLGQFDKALNILNENLKKDPQNHDFLNRKAYMLMYLDRKDESLKCISDLLELTDKPNYIDSYGEILKHFKMFRESVEQFEKIFKKLDKSEKISWLHESYIKASDAYFKLEDYEKAKKYAKIGLKLSIKNNEKKWEAIAKEILVNLKEK